MGANACLATSAQADPPPIPAVGEVVVTGQHQPGNALGDPQPLRQLSPSDIELYGAGSVGELLDALKPETKGVEGDPIVLLNGRRVSGLSVIKDLPAEAIAHLQILPEQEALRYGYGAGQRVVNIVLRDPFHSVAVDAEADGATEGGATAGKGDAGYTDIDRGTRISLDAKLDASSGLLASDRSVVVPLALGALGGASAPDLGRDESLRPWTRDAAISGVFSRGFGPVNATFDATFEAKDSRSDQGLAIESLDVPADDPFAPGSAATTLTGYVPQAGPLRQVADTLTGHAGLSLDGPLGAWAWSLTAAMNHAEIQTRTDVGVDLSPAQALLDADAPAFNPASSLPSSLIGDRLTDRAVSTSDTGGLALVLNGDPWRLPAGPVSATFKLGASLARQSSGTTAVEIDQPAPLQRLEGRGAVTLSVPIASAKRGVLPALGELSLNANLALDQVSDFGPLGSATAGLTWSPLPRVSVLASWALRSTAPAMDQLDAPTVATPNVTAFDYRLGQTVQVTELSGGDTSLKASHTQTANVTLDYQPLATVPLHALVAYTHSDRRNQVSTLPAPTAAVEAAFPDRFIRDAAGELVEIDARPVNFSQGTTDQLRWGFTANIRQSGAALGRPGAASGGGMVLIATDTWTFRDNLLIRAGLPPIDLLNGGAVTGSAPVHVVEGQAGLMRGALGAFVTAKWQSSTWVDNGSPSGDLYYGALATLNLRSFIDLGRWPSLDQAGWAQHLRITVSVDNLTDDHAHVRNGLGQTPQAFQPAYIDPVGRLIHFDVRKAF